MVPKPNISGVTLRGLLLALCAWLVVVHGPASAQNDRSTPPPSPARAAAGAPTTPMVVDDFSDASRWQIVASDGVEGKVSSVRVTGPDGSETSALRMDFDFKRGSGYCIVRRELDLALPVNYRVGFALMGSSGVLLNGQAQGFVNDLEFKLYDQTGDNVWWVRTPDYRYEPAWSRLRYVKRQLDFAWGPGGGKVPLERIKAIEFAVTSSAAGAASGNAGKGHMLLSDLRLEPLGVSSKPAGTADVLVNGAPAGRMVNGVAELVTLHEDRGGAALTIDFGDPAEFGGVMLAWNETPVAVSGAEVSLDGVREEPWALKAPPRQGRSAFYAYDGGEAQRVTLRFDGVRGAPRTLARVMLLPRDAATNPNRIAGILARSSPRGWYPRQFLDEQVTWAVFGQPGAEHEGLLGGDGQVEVRKLGMTIEPMLEYDAYGVETWADWKATASLPDGRVPLPRVELLGASLQSIRVEPMTFGRHTAVRYTVTNTSDAPFLGTLHLLLRPYQVLPYWHTLNIRGGTSPRAGSTMARSGAGSLEVADASLVTTAAGATARLAGVDARDIGAMIAGGTRDAAAVSDAGSGAVSVAFELAPGASRTLWTVASSGEVSPRPSADELDAEYARQQADWAERLGRVHLHFPAVARDIEDAFYAQLGWILVNRDGPAIQPGSRTYDRTWIRDGALTATALLYTGHAEEVREFLDWFRGFQYENGKVPCCADERGPDPVPEHDSHGQYVYGVATYHRFTHDDAFLRRHWPNVQKAVGYIEFLRAQRMTPEYAQAEGLKRAMYGLVPESISHEGYSAKPMHSYWDDLFTLRGLKDAAYIAEELGEADAAGKYAGLRDEFAAALVDSVQRAAAFHKIDYMPGCVELGDFDATSTAVAVFPCDAAGLLPTNLLERTFDKAWENFVARRDGVRTWNDYTPYENRMISAMLMLGHPDRAHAMLGWYMKDQNPPGWRQWSEIVWRDKEAPRFVGDTPHTWVGSDFLKAIRNLCVFERESDQSLVIGAGLPLEWLRAARADGAIGVKIADFPTKYGPISFTASATESEVTFEVSGGASPPGGVIVAPWCGKPVEPVRAGSLPAAVKVAIPR